MRSYIICATPRTGSTLLCDLLTATGQLGAPDSYVMRAIDPDWARDLGLPQRPTPGGSGIAAYFDAVIRVGRGGTPVFGLRLMRADLGDLCALAGHLHPGCTSDRARLEAAFGDLLFIHLARSDKLAQAVSMVRAEQTGLWHVAPDGTEVERLAPPQDPVYDFDRIAAKLAELQGFDTAWTSWFAAEGIAPLTIGYEDLSANPAGALARICHAMGTPAPALEAIRPGVAKLADATNADWIRRFRADAGLTG